MEFENDDLFFVTERRPKTNQELIDDYVKFVTQACEAMNETARTGLSNTASRIYSELESRATNPGGSGVLVELDARMTEVFGPKEQADVE